MDDLIGRTFGGLELQEEIGPGLYKAHDAKSLRWLVVKVLTISSSPGTVDETVRSRFRDQTQALMALTHRNILAILDYGEEGEYAFQVMDYMPGGSLQDRLQPDQPFNWEQALAIVVPISKALTVAHRAGIIHRDLKPSKILFSEDDLPVLANFELIQLDTRQDGTVVGADMYRMTYYAPERVQEGEADARSDIFSLALVLYEMLAGRLPYNADSTFDLLLARVTDSPLPISAANPAVPPVLDPVLDKALARQPNDRYQTMEQFSQALLEARNQLGQPAKAGGWIASKEDTAVGKRAVNRRLETKIVLSLTATGQQIYVGNEAEIIVGRASKKASLPNPDIDLGPFGGRQGGVSRKHGRLLRIDNRWFVEDLNSTNGTQVNGIKMPPRQTTALHQGDTLRFGQIELKVDLREEK
jgi:serine/threonine-protein kinase